ncbi:MAG TPA: DUF5989 family protein [Planctomycetota bacterium]|jgi:hypothetical protein|nr:DUF5989 family protein [Planctomycetota bacterium]HZJ70863.1 DUF5989 family protein [Planctomycetota bacterium]
MSSFRAFLVENKFWWITPIVIVLLLVGWLLYKTNTHEGASSDSPFIYDAY